VPRESPRTRPPRLLRSSHALRGRAPPRADERLARGGRRRAVQRRLSADRAPRRRTDHRIRSARSLAQPGARRSAARRVHPARRGRRSGRPDRPLRLRRRLPPPCGMAPPRPRARASHAHQPLGAGSARAGPRRVRRAQPAPLRAGRRGPRHRDHRNCRDPVQHALARLARAPARHRREPLHRRLRHGLLVAAVSAPAPVLGVQDRPLVRRKHRRVAGKRADRPHAGAARALLRDRRRRRRRRNGTPSRRADRARLRARARVPLLSPDVGRRRQRAARRGGAGRRGLVIARPLFAAAALTATLSLAQPLPASAGFVSRVVHDDVLFHPPYRPPLSTWSAPDAQGRRAISLTAADGTTLRGWFYPSTHPHAPFLLVFYGTQHTIAAATLRSRWLCDQGFNVVLFDYRGYGYSDGTPHLNTIVAD